MMTISTQALPDARIRQLTTRAGDGHIRVIADNVVPLHDIQQAAVALIGMGEIPDAADEVAKVATFITG